MTEDTKEKEITNIKLSKSFLITLNDVMKNQFNINCSSNADLVKTALRHFVMLYTKKSENKGVEDS